MSDTIPPNIASAVERQRISVLYSRLPGAVMSMMLGILLAFIFLFEIAPSELLKAWVAYMLTTLALRIWLWHQFRNTIVETERLRAWEWLYAAGIGLTALGWLAVCGPLYPQSHEMQDFVWVLLIFVSFSGMVMAAPSISASLSFLIPTLLPGLYRFVEDGGFGSMAMIIAVSCLGVVLITLRGLYNFTLESLQRQVLAEQLLAEQQAIFQGATTGIAVVEDGLLVKCNKRFGELFGRGLNSIQSLSALALFSQTEEGERFMTWANGEFDAGRSAHSMERMRRADGTQFWAEISGRRLEYGTTVRNLWLVSEASMQHTQAAHGSRER